MAQTFTLQRDIPIDDQYDLVVGGGGPAGSAAAISAARAGAKVLLIEQSGCLGGMGTNALVSGWSHMANGEHPIIGGLFLEIVETMYKQGCLQPEITPEFWMTIYNRGFGYDTEAYKMLLDRLCIEAGVEIRFFTRVVDVDVDPDQKVVRGVITNCIEGYRFIPAKTVVDATGDAFLADMCGVEYWQAGRDTDGIMPPTLCSLLSDIDYDRFSRPIQQESVDRALADGFFSQRDRHFPGIFRTGERSAILNAGHLFGTDATSVQSLTDAMIKGRELAQEYAAFCREYLDGCEDLALLLTAPMLGVRESRRIIGETTVTHADYQARRHFPDQIAIYCKQVDIHVFDDSDEEYERYHTQYNDADLLKPGESYGLPYGILVPKGWQNLWVAGRCASADVKVHGAIRDQPACTMMGEAAGTAVVQAINTGQTAPALDTDLLVRTLKTNGANV